MSTCLSLTSKPGARSLARTNDCVELEEQVSLQLLISEMNVESDRTSSTSTAYALATTERIPVHSITT